MLFGDAGECLEGLGLFKMIAKSEQNPEGTLLRTFGVDLTSPKVLTTSQYRRGHRLHRRGLLHDRTELRHPAMQRQRHISY